MPKKLTPAQQQYADLKRQHSDAILFFRLGDFYETFHEDAQIAHRELDITLTAKNKSAPHPIPMAGVPHHSLEKYVQRLVDSGYKVAIADQVGEVTPGKVVDREVVRVVTPGTTISDRPDFQFIAAITQLDTPEQSYHLVWGDFSVGSYMTRSFDDVADLLHHIRGLSAKELVVDIDLPDREEFVSALRELADGIVSIHDQPHDIDEFLCRKLKVTTLSGYGKALGTGRREAVALLFSYLEHTQKRSLTGVSSVQLVSGEGTVHMDLITLKNLEVFESSYEGSQKHSLYGVINTTNTAMGARLLATRLSTPVNNKKELTVRYRQIEHYQNDKELRDQIVETMSRLPDIPRLTSRVLYHAPSALKVQNLMHALGAIVGPDSGYCQKELHYLGLSKELTAKVRKLFDALCAALKDEKISDQSDYIRDGYDQQIDTLREVAYHSDDQLITYQKKLTELTGLQTIKLKYVTNQGYFIELSKKESSAFEEYIRSDDERTDFVRSQTLKSAERYVSTYLSTLQTKIEEASQQLHEKEQALLLGLIDSIASHYEELSLLSEYIARLDLVSSFAQFAHDHNWTKPEIGDGYCLEIKEGTHPVIQAYLPASEQFIPNDLFQDHDRSFHLITGPNMGGKSTFLRQNALIVLLSHAGLYVPARSAKVGLVDGIFARVGSGDILAKNQSTFMTEMVEMANILHNATERSFVILDELGRGTSTYDGMALAKAIVVYMCQHVGCKTLFATHYHELTQLATQLDNVENFSVSVYETDQDIVFLKKVVRGGVSKSYGIDVAKLAGVPHVITDQASIFLQELENGLHTPPVVHQSGFNFGAINDTYRQTIKQLKKQIDQLSINEITPIEGLLELQRIKKLLDDIQ